MKTPEAVGRSAGTAWITRAEAAFLAGVSTDDVDAWVATGRVRARTVGDVVLIDPSGLREESAVNPPAEARSVRGARARSGRARRRTRAGKAPEPPRTPKPPKRSGRSRSPRAPLLDRPVVVIGSTAIAMTVALLVLQFTMFGTSHRPAAIGVHRASPSATATDAASIPVGRDPFADPFAAAGKGDTRGAVLVKPPGVVRDGEAVTAAATVVNEDHARWLPPSELTFVARDGSGRVIARASTTVSLGPGKAETVVAPDLGADPSAIAAIEAHIRPAPLRTGGYHAPAVTVARAAAVDDGKAIAGMLSVDPGAPATTTLACAMFDGLHELADVTTKNVDLRAARGRHLRFWLTAQPTAAGPYTASCSVSPA
jgi:hypothetical protein